MKIESLVKVGTLLYWGGFLSLVVVVKILVFVDFIDKPDFRAACWLRKCFAVGSHSNDSAMDSLREWQCCSLHQNLTQAEALTRKKNATTTVHVCVSED